MIKIQKSQMGQVGRQSITLNFFSISQQQRWHNITMHKLILIHASGRKTQALMLLEWECFLKYRLTNQVLGNNVFFNHTSAIIPPIKGHKGNELNMN